MSLDVYLYLSGVPREKGSGIFVRDGGQTREVSREEWDRSNPGREPIVVLPPDEDEGPAFHANVTHNLAEMAEAAGIYECLWRPDEIGITTAAQLNEPLTAGLAQLKADPERFIDLNPINGWGSYEQFVPWVERYLAACVRYPDATVEVSR